MSNNKMILRIWSPERQIFESKSDKVVAEAVNGFFCLLPRHIDFLAELAPGILSTTLGGQEQYLAVDRGILVKCGFEVKVSTRNAIPGDDLEHLVDQVQTLFREADRKEEQINQAIKRLEADFVRRFSEMSLRRAGG